MVIVSVFMIIIVLVQKSKGGGLNQSFASQAQLVGVRKSADFVEKATWWLAGIMLVLSLSAVALMPSVNAEQQDAGLDRLLENQAQQTAEPAFPAAAPAEGAQPAATAPAEAAPVEAPATEAPAAE